MPEIQPFDLSSSDLWWNFLEGKEVQKLVGEGSPTNLIADERATVKRRRAYSIFSSIPPRTNIVLPRDQDACKALKNAYVILNGRWQERVSCFPEEVSSIVDLCKPGWRNVSPRLIPKAFQDGEAFRHDKSLASIKTKILTSAVQIPATENVGRERSYYDRQVKREQLHAEARGEAGSTNYLAIPHPSFRFDISVGWCMQPTTLPPDSFRQGSEVGHLFRYATQSVFWSNDPVSKPTTGLAENNLRTRRSRDDNEEDLLNLSFGSPPANSESSWKTNATINNYKCHPMRAAVLPAFRGALVLILNSPIIGFNVRKFLRLTDCKWVGIGAVWHEAAMLHSLVAFADLGGSIMPLVGPSINIDGEEGDVLSNRTVRPKRVIRLHQIACCSPSRSESSSVAGHSAPIVRPSPENVDIHNNSGRRNRKNSENLKGTTEGITLTFAGRDLLKMFNSTDFLDFSRRQELRFLSLHIEGALDPLVVITKDPKQTSMFLQALSMSFLFQTHTVLPVVVDRMLYSPGQS